MYRIRGWVTEVVCSGHCTASTCSKRVHSLLWGVATHSSQVRHKKILTQSIKKAIVDSRLPPPGAQFTTSTSVLYRWTKFGWNLGCYACRILSLLNTWSAICHYTKTWHHPQNWKYITYRNAVRGGPSHHHRQHAQKFGEVWPHGFWVLQADRQTHKQTYSSQYFATLPRWSVVYVTKR